MLVSDFYSGKYFKAKDVPKPRLLTIKTVEVETLPDDERKGVVYFQDEQRGLVLNATNANAARELYGDDTSAWAGKQIVLFATTCDFQGRRVDCLRVRAPKNQAQPPEEADCPF